MTPPREHRIPTPHGELPALLWLPEGAETGSPVGGGVPGLVVLQEIYGLSDYIRARCADLAEMGFAVLAPQLYARLDPPVDAVQEDGVEPEAALGQALELVAQIDWDVAVADALAATDDLAGLEQVDGDQVGLLGFCFGGGLAFAATAAATQRTAANLAATATQRTTPAALVSYYGSALPNLLALAPQVDCPSLHHFGTADTYLPMEQVELIRDAVTDQGRREQVQVELHEGAGHAFDNPNPLFHHAGASALAWQQTQEFLAEHLPVARS